MSDPVGPRFPRVMLVTDRRRLAEGVGVRESDWEGVLIQQIQGAVAGGVDLVQVREPDLSAARLSQFLRTLFQNVAYSRDRIVVNDRLDIALGAGARGVHLPEQGLQVAAARALSGADRLLVGRSVHDVPAAAASRGADYLIAGSVHASRSHPGGRVMGWEGFRDVVVAADGIPVLAIGGLGIGDVEAIVRAGGTGLAAVDWFVPPRGTRDLAGFVHERVVELGKSWN